MSRWDEEERGDFDPATGTFDGLGGPDMPRQNFNVTLEEYFPVVEGVKEEWSMRADGTLVIVRGSHTAFVRWGAYGDPLFLPMGQYQRRFSVELDEPGGPVLYGLRRVSHRP